MKTLEILNAKRLTNLKVEIWHSSQIWHSNQQPHVFFLVWDQPLARALNPRELSDYAFDAGAIEVRHAYDLTLAEE